jgi:UDP-N-acetylmuramoyl-tripeptide--D-alanyl-D-alanine ligase
MDIRKLYDFFINNPFISTDSRKIEKGCIYFALKGDNFDGNTFAAQALEKGAAYAVIDNNDYYINDRTILVENALSALQELAKYHRSQFSIPILAITGTNGKTTTKELVREVIAQKYNVLSTKGNLNNHIGVPLTLLSLTKSHEFAIIEMGANHPFEIELLCKIGRPTYGIITNIGKAHLEGFGGFEGVIKTKRELYDFLAHHNGTIFYNSDNKLLSSLVENLTIDKESYGELTGSICTGRVISNNQFINVAVKFISEFTSDKNEIEVKSNLVGAYNLENILAATAIGSYFKVSADKIKSALENYKPDNNRSQFLETSKNKLIVDCYNANPSSTQVAIENFVKLSDKSKVLMLGDMFELGSEAVTEHIAILQILKKYELNAILVGKVYHSIAEKFGYMSFEDVISLKKWLDNNPVTNKTILIKGSRGVQLEKILENL